MWDLSLSLSLYPSWGSPEGTEGGDYQAWMDIYAVLYPAKVLGLLGPMGFLGANGGEVGVRSFQTQSRKEM